jgi:hypothetical protein
MWSGCLAALAAGGVWACCRVAPREVTSVSASTTLLPFQPQAQGGRRVRSAARSSPSRSTRTASRRARSCCHAGCDMSHANTSSPAIPHSRTNIRHCALGLPRRHLCEVRKRIGLRDDEMGECAAVTCSDGPLAHGAPGEEGFTIRLGCGWPSPLRGLGRPISRGS